MVRWTGLAPWESEFPFPGSLTSTFLAQVEHLVRLMREVQRDREAARERGASARAYVAARCVSQGRLTLKYAIIFRLTLKYAIIIFS